MANLNFAVVGLGKMGLLHGGIFNSLNGCKVSAIADSDKLTLNMTSKYLKGVRAYHNFESMLEKERLDAIIITTPIFLHRLMIEKAMDYGLHIFVEKPLALDGSDCRSIINHKYKSQTLVGYCRRFMGTYNLARKIIKESILGEVNYFNSQLFVGQIFNQGKGWLYDPSKSGEGVLTDLGSHAIDMFNYMFGDIEYVQGFGRSIFNKNLFDYITINAKFQNGIIGTFQLSWSIKNYRLPELKFNIYLDKGTIQVTEKYIEIYSEVNEEPLKKGWNIFYKQNLMKPVPINIAGSEYTEEDLHFLNCIENKDTQTLCNFNEAAKTNFILDAIGTSLSSGDIQRVNGE